MEIRHLKLIEAVAEDGSLTKATEKLFLSQSALSHQLREMEKQLGTAVFHRVNKKLILTDAGKLLLKSARVILNELEEAKAEIKRNMEGDRGELRLCTVCYTCYHWLPPLLKKFSYDYPNVDVSINTDNVMDPLDLLVNGNLDLAIVYKKLADKNINYHHLFKDELVVVISANHKWNAKRYVKAEDFADQTLLTHSKNYLNSITFQSLLTPANVKPKKVIYMQITEAVMEMVKADLGVALFSRWAIKPYLETRKINTVRVTKNGLFRNWYAATLNNNNQPSFLDCFVHQLQREIRL